MKICNNLSVGVAGNAIGQTGMFSLNSLQQIITTTRLIHKKRNTKVEKGLDMQLPLLWNKSRVLYSVFLTFT